MMEHTEELLYQKAKDYATLESIEDYLSKYPNGKYVNELLSYKDKIEFFEKSFNKFVDIDLKIRKYNFIFLILISFINAFILTFYYVDYEIDYGDYGDYFIIAVFMIALLIGLVVITMIIKKIIQAIIKNLFKSFSDILYLYYLEDIKSKFGFISIDFIKNFNTKINRFFIVKLFLYDMIIGLVSLSIVILFLICNPEYIERVGGFILAIMFLILIFMSGGK